MCVCLAVLMQSWLIALQTGEAPPVSFAGSSHCGSQDLSTSVGRMSGDFHEIKTHSVSQRQTKATTEDEYVWTRFPAPSVALVDDERIEREKKSALSKVCVCGLHYTIFALYCATYGLSQQHCESRSFV